MKTELHYRVPYADTDQMGVVYYANYLEYFERLRNEFLRDAGLPYKELEARGVMLPVIEAHCDYRRPAHYDDELLIVGWCSEIKRTRVRIECEVFRGATLLASGYTVHACVDAATRRPVRAPAVFHEFVLEAKV